MASDDSYRAHPADDDGLGGVSHDEIAIQSGELARIECPTAESLSDSPLKAGWLTKRGYKLGCMPTWKRRYFILKGQYIFKFESPTVSWRHGWTRWCAN
jgi:hypothetical protein